MKLDEIMAYQAAPALTPDLIPYRNESPYAHRWKHQGTQLLAKHGIGVAKKVFPRLRRNEVDLAMKSASDAECRRDHANLLLSALFRERADEAVWAFGQKKKGGVVDHADQQMKLLASIYGLLNGSLDGLNLTALQKTHAHKNRVLNAGVKP